MKYGQVKKMEILRVVGDHVSEKQLRNFLNQLKSSGMIKTAGERGKTVYMLGDNYIRSNEVLMKALDIGLKDLKGKGEI